MEAPQGQTAEPEAAEGRLLVRLRRVLEVGWGAVECAVFLCVALACVPLWITRWACDRAAECLWWIASWAGPGLRHFNGWRVSRREVKESFARIVNAATLLNLEGTCRRPTCGADEEEEEGEEGKDERWARSARAGRRRRSRLRMLR